MKSLLIALLAVAAASLAPSRRAGSRRSRIDDRHVGCHGPALLALITNDDVFSTADLSYSSARPDRAGRSISGPIRAVTGLRDLRQRLGNRLVRPTLHGWPERRGGAAIQERGSFVTDAGASPGSCDITDGSPPGTVSAGIIGSMHGYFIISTGPVPQSSDPSCVAAPSTPCTTAGFDQHPLPRMCYPSPPCTVVDIFFHFPAGDQGLVEHRVEERLRRSGRQPRRHPQHERCARSPMSSRRRPVLPAAFALSWILAS